MQSIKGRAIISVIDFAKENSLWERVSAELSTKNRTIVSDVILPSQWYPLEDHIQLLELIVKHSGGDPSIGIKIGKIILSDGLNKYYKIILGILSKKYILSKAPVLWKGYFNSEALNIIEVENKSLKVSVTDKSGSVRINKVYCFSVLGGMLQTIATVGGKNIKSSEVRCRCDNESACEYHITWE